MATYNQDICAALSALTYHLQGADMSDITLGDLIQRGGSYITEEVREIIRANGLDNARVLDASWNSSGTYGSMNAMAVEIDGQLYVAYRGTGEGNWKYNADSAFGPESSDMQKWSSSYFDYVMENYGGTVDNVYVTGHSQGGNNAIYTLLFSRYADRITNCISLDGPGFSMPIISDAISRLGEDEYQSRLQKIYAYYGENDYVHGLGEVHLVPKEHIYYVPTPNVKNPALYHDLATHMTNGKFNTPYPQGEGEGPVSKLVTSMMENMMENLSPEDRYEVAQYAMTLVESLIGEGRGNPDYADQLVPLEWVVLVDHLLPVLKETAIEHPEQIVDVLHVPGIEEYVQVLKDWIQEHPLETIAILAVASVAISAIRNIATDVKQMLLVVQAVKWAVETLEYLEEGMQTAMLELLQTMLEYLEGVYNWITSNASAAANYVAENPYFQADPVRLRDYADRVDRVNQRLRQLDSDMNSLYWQVGLLDLWDILMANLITGGSPALRQVSAYLRDAAEELERADWLAMDYMGG